MRVAAPAPGRRAGGAWFSGDGDGGADGEDEADAVAVANVGWEAEEEAAAGRLRKARAQEGAASAEAGVGAQVSGARDVARVAARLELAVEAMPRSDLFVLRKGERSVWGSASSSSPCWGTSCTGRFRTTQR